MTDEYTYKLDPNMCKKTSDGGNRNHSVMLPMILNFFFQKLQSTYINSLLVSILRYCISVLISLKERLNFLAKIVIFYIEHIEK